MNRGSRKTYALDTFTINGSTSNNLEDLVDDGACIPKVYIKTERAHLISSSPNAQLSRHFLKTYKALKNIPCYNYNSTLFAN